jgi:hypothetical protein
LADHYAPSSRQGAPPDALRARVEAELGERWLSWSKPDTGLTAAHRFIVALAGGGGIFVKAATTTQTAAQLRNERLALQHAPAELAPAVLAWIDDGDDAPILVVEAVAAAHWPASRLGVNWREGDLDRVFAAIRRLSALDAPGSLPIDRSQATAGWARILSQPDSFVGLRLCSATWLAANGEALARAEAALDRCGGAFVHGDMRSDNICLTADGVKFVDWTNARSGAPDTDLAIFLPAAHLEGGPAPIAVMPDGAPWAAQQAAELALRALEDSRAPPEWLRRVFRRLARINLDWAIASLGLPPRDA